MDGKGDSPGHSPASGSAAPAQGADAGALAASIARAAPRGPAPVHLWNPPYCGEIDIEIRPDGVWWHEGTPITREPLVRLLASVLKREDDGRFYLVTPVEKLGIRVTDAPFVAVDADIGPQGLIFTTNLGEQVVAGAENPVRVALAPDGTPRPYVHVRRGLEALIDRKTFYRLVEAAGDADADGRLILRAGHDRFELSGRAD